MNASSHPQGPSSSDAFESLLGEAWSRRELLRELEAWENKARYQEPRAGRGKFCRRSA